MKPLLSSVLLPSLLAIAGTIPAATPSAPHGTGGGVASAAPDATRAGLEILASGGNAVDAAVATALSLAVVHPSAGNLGGGGFAVVRMGDEISSLDFRETAPSAATSDMYLDERGEPIREASWIGPLAAGVPGSPAGLHALHQRYGQLPWKAVVAPSIALARDGFVVTKRLHDSLNRARPLLERFPETVAVWFPNGRAPAAGSIMRLPELAASLVAYAEHGPEALTSGPVAEAIVRVSSLHGGIISAEDLAGYRPVWREPVRTSAFGWDIASMSLPSSGGLILAQSAAILQRLDWASLPRGGADRAHVLAETWRRAYADRFRLGDPDTTEVAPASLLDGDLLDRRAAAIDRTAATPSDRVLPIAAEAPAESAETTHLSVVDGDGNAVSLTTTLNGAYGCGLLVPGAGYLLNNEMDDFAAAPGRPNAYGLVQGRANAVRPGRRMLSSMTPTLAWRGDEIIAVGAPGGSRIPTGTMQVLFNLLVDGDELQAAVNRPRLHHQWRPDRLEAETDALAPETWAVLETRGHRVVARGAVGLVQAVQRLATGEIRAAADPRGPGSAGVVNPAPGTEGWTP
jgi:gamma-glutamyltranspeptidase/glutathione hydrolase